jgi:hypothetical protein
VHGIVLHTPGENVSRVYEHFMARGFRPTHEAIGRIVVDTHEHPDTVAWLYNKFMAGVGSVTEASVERHYDEQIRALDAELERRRGRK